MALLCESWSRAARREPSTAFAFDGHSAKAVKNKLQHLRTVLPPEIVDLPARTPPELLGDALARCKLLASVQGRKELMGNFEGTTWEDAIDAEIASDSVQS